MTGSSSTARIVLQGVWLTACDPATRDLVPVDLRDATRAAMRRTVGERRTRRFESAVVRRALRVIEWAMLPGICTHYVARKNAIHAIASAADVDQLVVLGGGLDALAWRIAGERPAVRCIEIDHPATQADKRRVLADLPDRGVTLIACDLADADAAERAVAALPARRTLFVAEGLLMYLPPHAVERILRAIARRGDRAAVTFMMPDARGRPAFAARQSVVRQFLRWAKEPFTWALRPDAAGDYFADIGLHFDALRGASWPGADVTIEAHMIAGEWLAVLVPSPGIPGEG